MSALIHYLATSLSPIEIVFFRNLFGLIIIFPFVARRGLLRPAKKTLPLYFARAAVGLISMTAWFSAIGMMPLAEAIALNFTVPLFAIFIAIFLLGEKVGRHRWSATILGFAGTLVILRPGVIEFSLGAGLALGSALGFALAMGIVKILSRTERPTTVVFYQGVIMTPVSLIPALFVWQTPSWTELGWLALLGAIATFGHIALVRAFAAADSSAITPLDFTRLPFATAFGYFLFDERIDLWTWIGAAIIIASTVYIARREAILGRRVIVPARGEEPLNPPG
jgi:drug/metabolite transporter (DMT)-like permease